jgi:hypothetical protein
MFGVREQAQNVVSFLQREVLMSEPSSKLAKGGMLVGVAAIITALVPLFTNTAGDRADKADDKAELVMALIKQHLEFQGKEIDELKQENRDFRKVMRHFMGHNAWIGEGAAEPEPPPPEPAPTYQPVARPASGGGGAGSLMALALDDEMPVPDEELEEIAELIEEEPPEAPIQQQAPIPSPKQLDALLAQ